MWRSSEGKLESTEHTMHNRFGLLYFRVSKIQTAMYEETLLLTLTLTHTSTVVCCSRSLSSFIYVSLWLLLSSHCSHPGAFTICLEAVTW